VTNSNVEHPGVASREAWLAARKRHVQNEADRATTGEGRRPGERSASAVSSCPRRRRVDPDVDFRLRSIV